MVFSIIFGINWITLGVLFILAFLSSFGLPGALFLMIFLGILAKTWTDIFLIAIASLFGVVIGDISAYEIARKLKSSFHSKLEKLNFFKEKEKETKKLLKDHMFYLIFFTRFALRTITAVVNYISGFKKVDRKRFIFTIIFGGIIYAFLYPLIGFFFKKTWEGIVNLIWQISLLLFLGILFIWLIKRKIKNKKKP